MPRFFFDVDDGERILRDENGISLPGPERAKTEALMLMRDLVFGVPATGKTILGCVVKGESGAPIHRLMMTIEGEDCAKEPPTSNPSASEARPQPLNHV